MLLLLLLLLLLNQIKVVINDLFLLFSLSVCFISEGANNILHYKGIFKLKRTNYNDWLNILISNLTDIRRTSLISLIRTNNI